MSHRFPGKQYRRVTRSFLALMVAIFMLVQAAPNAFAQATTGVLSGTVKDAATQAPLANVQVSAVSPTGRYTSTTNSAGFYVITGAFSDTYTVSFSLAGYDPISLAGQNVFAGQTATVNAFLTKTIKTIARVTSRSPGGAFQPRQPIDTYTVTNKGVQTILGSAPNFSESTLISSLPGGSLDSSGYPVIRGGRENEENFEFESIPYTDAFTNQFTNSLAAPGLGLQSVQLTPGIGNASADNIGTGTFNLVAKRGTYPGFASLQPSIGGPAFRHGLNGEYGFASPNGKISNYFTLASDQIGRAYGGLSVDCRTIGTCYSRFFQPDREVVDNLVWKFGNNGNQQLQLFIDSAQHNFYNGWGGFNRFNNLCYKTCDPVYLQFASSVSGFGAPSLTANCTVAVANTGACSVPPGVVIPAGTLGQPIFPTIANLLGCGTIAPPTAPSSSTIPAPGGAGIPGSANANPAVCGLTTSEYTLATLLPLLSPGQIATFQSLGSANQPPSVNYQPNQAMKIGYMWNINPSTNLQAMAYRVNSVVTFGLSLSGGYGTGSSRNQLQGGISNGLKLDFTKQLSEQHLIRAGAKMVYLNPVFDGGAYNYGPYITSLLGNNVFGPRNFFSPTQCAANGTGAGALCGYIYDTAQQAAVCPPATAGCPAGHATVAGTLFPTSYENTSVTRTDYGIYLNDTWSPSDKWRFDIGGRLDQFNYHFPNPSMDLSTCTSLFQPYYQYDSNGKLITVASTNPLNQTMNPVTGLPYTAAQLSNPPATTSGGFPSGYCPAATFNLTNAMRKPTIPQPILSFSYQMGANDAIRAAWGRSVEPPTLAGVDDTAAPQFFTGPPNDAGAFNQIPGYLGSPFIGYNGPTSSVFGGCGFLYDQRCITLSEQLYWSNTNIWAGQPYMPVRPPVFTNADFSYEHQFTKGWLNGVGVKITPYWRKAQDETAFVQYPILAGGQAVLNPVTQAPFYYPSIDTNLGVSQDTGVEMQWTREVPYGLSGQVTVTYQNELSSVIPTASSEDFYPAIPAASVFAGNVYRVGFLSPLVAAWDLSYQTRSGWRINPQITWNVGYPISPGSTYPVTLNGKYINIVNTNAISLGALGGTPVGSTAQYVDPLNPGSFLSPNIAATRGIPITAAPGGKLSHPSSTTNLTLEYNGQRYWNAGITVFNLFDALYGGPVLNGRYQPVATGYSGPVSGQNATAWAYQTPYGFAVNNGANRYGQNAYQDTPSGIRSYYFYLTLKL